MANEQIDGTDHVHFKVEVELYNVCTRWPCLLCRGSSEKTNVLAVLIGYTEDREKKADFGEICEQCLDAGREGAAERMRRHAGHLRERADWLEQLADNVVHAESWASSDDVESARLEFDKEMARDREAREDDPLPF